jgi:hypothetical protein
LQQEESDALGTDDDIAGDSRTNEMDVDEGMDSSPIDFDSADTTLEDDKISEAESASAALSIPLSFGGLFRLLFMQATQKSQTISDEYLPYMVAALQGLQSLMSSLPPGSDKIKSFIYDSFSANLVTIISGNGGETTAEIETLPPVVVAGALDVLASTFWLGIGQKEEISQISTSAPTADDILNLLQSSGGSHAWTVREASASCMASLASVCMPEWLLRQHRVASTMVKGAEVAFRDRKYWRVR